MTTAEFTISADPFSNLGYDATPSEVLTLQLAASPALDVNQTTFSQVAKSSGAPDLVFSPVTGIPATPTGTVTTTMPSSGMHSWLIRCEITTASTDTDDTQERIVAIRQGGLRKIVPSERTEYDGTYGWTEAINGYGGALSLIGSGAWREPVRAVTAAALPANTRTGNTLDANANGALPNQDGIAMAVDDRLLVWQEAASHLKHGIYKIDDLGSAGTKWAMTRVATFDESTEAITALTVAVQEGSTYGGHAFRLTTTGTITINTTALTFDDVGILSALVTTSDAGVVGSLGANNTVLTNPAGAAGGVWATLVDANIDAAAAIAGSKISPNFGAQTVQTTGLVLGGQLRSGSSVLAVANGDVSFGLTGAGEWFYDQSNETIHLYDIAGPTEKIRIDISDPFIGIGTTAPSSTEGLRVTDGARIETKLTTTGGRERKVVNATGNYTVGPSDDVIECDTGSVGAFNVDLPAIVQGACYTVARDGNGGGNAATVRPNGADTIVGAANYALGAAYDSATFIGGTGTDWIVEATK